MSDNNYNTKNEIYNKSENKSAKNQNRRIINNNDDRLKYAILDHGQIEDLKQKPKTLNIFYTYLYIWHIYQFRINELARALTEEKTEILSWCKNHREFEKIKKAALSFLQDPQSFKNNEEYTNFFDLKQNDLKTNQVASHDESKIIDNEVDEIEEMYSLHVQQLNVEEYKPSNYYSWTQFANQTESGSKMVGEEDKSSNYYSWTQFAKSYEEMSDLLTKSLNGYIPRFLGDIFITTEFLHSNFKINFESYKRYEKWIKFWNDGTYDKNQGQCRHIRSFSQVFMEMVSLMESEIGTIYIPEDWYLQYCYSVTPFQQETIAVIERFKSQCQDMTILSKVKYQKYSHSTKVSPFRTYNSAVNMPKIVRREIFKGYGLCDLNAAFASIAWYELDMKNCNLEGAELLNPLRKKEMRQKIMETFKGMALDKAKQTSQYLFSQRYTHSWGVEWFDNLHKEISKRVYQKLQQKEIVKWNNKDVKIDTYHKWFTYHEQQIMLSLNQNILLQIHDGVIFRYEDSLIVKSIDLGNDFVEYKGNKYYFSVEII